MLHKAQGLSELLPEPTRGLQRVLGFFLLGDHTDIIYSFWDLIPKIGLRPSIWGTIKNIFWIVFEKYCF
jgi:hypothetical protein